MLQAETLTFLTSAITSPKIDYKIDRRYFAYFFLLLRGVGKNYGRGCSDKTRVWYLSCKPLLLIFLTMGWQRQSTERRQYIKIELSAIGRQMGAMSFLRRF